MYPKIKFRVDLEMDLKTFRVFVKDAKYGNGQFLNWAILKPYPYFKQYRAGIDIKISNAKLKEFVGNFYKENRNIIKENLILYEKNWRRVEKRFYSLVDKYFCKRSWPKGKYISYPTMWGMYPRYLDDKTFQIPYKHKKVKYVDMVIAHEMLHFLFYDYFFSKYPKYRNSRYDFLVWHASEIFNIVLLNSKEWFKVFRIKCLAYFEHEVIVRKLSKKKWKDIDLLIEEIIKEIKNSKDKRLKH